MTKDLLWRGMLAGILAALLATLFGRAFAEPQIDLAIGYEHSHEAMQHPMAMPPGGGEEVELVSRDTQKGWGLLTALALYGAAVGGIFSLVFAYGYGRFTTLGPRSFALLLAGMAFLLIVIVPGIKYPQTPPAVGKHETVALRTAAYFAMIVLSLGSAVVASKLRRLLTGRRNGFDATLLAIGSYLVLILTGQLLLPIVDEVPADFPATVLWNFRLTSIATQLLLWSTIGIAFGIWAEAVLRRYRA
jgi:predicted cobalt transporter CbtA